MKGCCRGWLIFHERIGLPRQSEWIWYGRPQHRRAQAVKKVWPTGQRPPTKEEARDSSVERA